MVVTLGQQYNTGEKSTVMLYTYIINRHAGTPDKNKTKTYKNRFIILNGNNSAIDLYTRGFAKMGYTPLFLRQKGTHLEND